MACTARERTRSSRPALAEPRQYLLPQVDAIEAQIEAESLPTFLSGMLYDDGVIDPRDTRTVLGMCLSAIASGPIEGTSNFGVFRM